MRGSREISLVPSLHRASTDALIYIYIYIAVHKPSAFLLASSLSHENPLIRDFTIFVS